jgi:hypothetical protein
MLDLRHGWQLLLSERLAQQWRGSTRWILQLTHGHASTTRSCRASVEPGEHFASPRVDAPPEVGN